jgi:zinc/manganese transport system substrate-binding protein
VAGGIYAFSVIFGPVGGMIGRLVPMRHLEAWEHPMRTRRSLLAASLAAFFAASLNTAPVHAQEKLPVIATFSILSDLVKNVGGDRVEVTTLVGPGGDAHVYVPTPADAKKVAAAKVVVVNGLGFEGWLTRLVKASGTKAPTVTVSKGIKTRKMEADDHGHGHQATDPHAWQSVANTKVYIANIRDGLSKADPAGKSTYEANAKAYSAKLDALEAEVKDAIAKIPAERRRIITSHDAFGYFGAAYGIKFISPGGVSTESAPSAKEVAKSITQIKKQKIPAVFMENISDARMMEQIAKESGAKIGGQLFSDALSDDKGPAPTYIEMMRNNVHQLAIALTS